tara:strand:+ start:712 stop:930 length:219 start_codon:yes stop_codon:yes gene_type:complete
MDNEYVNTVREIFEGLSEGDRCHMANLLFKEGYVASKVARQLAEAAENQREFDIVDSACDYWKQTAEDLGYV